MRSTPGRCTVIVTEHTLTCDAAAVPSKSWVCSAKFGPFVGRRSEARAAAKDAGWSREGDFDLCPEHTCPFAGFGHTKDWCGYPFCRES